MKSRYIRIQKKNSKEEKRTRIVKNRILLLLLIAIFIIAACGRKNYPPAHVDSSPVVSTVHEVPYKLASNYFSRNDLNSSLTLSKKIYSREEFTGYFGMAAVMGTKPTIIDFSTQFVIAVVLPETDYSTILTVDNLILNDGVLTLTYSSSVGEKQPFYVRPTLLLIVDRVYNGELLVLNK